MLGITPGALRLPLCYVQMPASGWFVGEGLDPPAGLCAAASVPGDTAPIGYCCRAGLSHPAAAAWGQAALRFSWKMCAGSRGVGNAAPYSCNFFSNFCLTTALYHVILLALVKTNRSKYPTFGTTIARPVRFSPRAGRFYGADG